MAKVLNEYGEELEASFYEDYEKWNGGCTCFISPPCGFCLHPGNPFNLAETPEAWEEENSIMDITKEMLG